MTSPAPRGACGPTRAEVPPRSVPSLPLRLGWQWGRRRAFGRREDVATTVGMTVPLLFGWEQIMTVLTVVVVVAVLFVVVRSTWADRTERSEWQSWLEGRSSRHQDS